MGYPVGLSIREIVSYPEDRFSEAVSKLIDEKQKCLLMLGWLDTAPEVFGLLQRVIANPTNEIVGPIFEAWVAARRDVFEIGHESDDSNHSLVSRPFEVLSNTPVYQLSEVASAILANLRAQLSWVEFGWIAAEVLINPLELIDLDYANHLAAELPDTPSEAEALSFAAPDRVNIGAQAISDARSAGIVTRFQELHLAAVQTKQDLENGIEITFKVSPLPQYILVIENEGRYYLRSGMHRAFALVRAGLRRIPCFLARVDELGSIIGPYPVFPSDVLTSTHPPMLLDALNERRALKIGYQQTRRLLRVSADETTIPVIE